MKKMYIICLYINGSKNVNIDLTVSEFVNFINNDVLKDTTYSANINSATRENLSKISKFLNKNIITKNMNSEEMSKLFELNKEQVEQLYLYYYSINGVDNKISINQFANFVLNNVVTNKEYKNQFDEKSLENLKLLQTMSNTNIIDKNMSSKELSAMFGMKEELINQLLLLIYSSNANSEDVLPINLQLSPYQLVDFIIKNSNNPQISANITTEQLQQLQSAYKIMVDAKNNTTYNYEEISKFTGITTAQTKPIYALYVQKTSELKLTPRTFVKFMLEYQNDEKLKGSLDTDSIKNLQLINTIMESVIDNKKYSAKEMANLFGLVTDDVKLLYSLYSAKYINTNLTSSLKEFIDFTLKQVVTNKKYSANFSANKIDKLNAINGIMNGTIKETKYLAPEIYGIISKLTDNIDKNTIEVLYIYYGSETYFKNDWTLTLEELINYANDDILKDERFIDFIDQEMKDKVADSIEMINDNKKLLVGDNYSRVVINTKYDMESDETFEFIQSIYDMLEGAECYIIGDSPMAYEMSKTFEGEFNYISILTMVFIFIVVAITFKSILIPLILVLIIQCAVYTTMGILSLFGGSVYFIALLIVQSILMGATIDYAILYTSYYKESRESLEQQESVVNSYNKSIHTILTSSSILISATFLVGQFSSGIISKICLTLSKGVLCSTVLILLILPSVLVLFDKIIIKNK